MSKHTLIFLVTAVVSFVIFRVLFWLARDKNPTEEYVKERKMGVHEDMADRDAVDTVRFLTEQGRITHKLRLAAELLKSHVDREESAEFVEYEIVDPPALPAGKESESKKDNS